MAVYPGISTAVWNYRAVSPRRVRPFILAAIHITDNPRLPSALQEAMYSNRVGSTASFHFVVNRNGSIVQCVDPVTTVAWTNGSWLSPNWNLSTVVKAVTQGYGANDSTFMTIEHVGSEGAGYPINAQQIAATGKLIAWGSKVSGISVQRVHVLGHADYDSVNRRYCPTRYNREVLLGRIISAASAILTPTPSVPLPAGPSEGFPLAFYNMAPWKATILAGKPIREGPSTKYETIVTTTTPLAVRLYIRKPGQILGGTNAWYGFAITNPASPGSHVLGWSPRIDMEGFRK